MSRATESTDRSNTPTDCLGAQCVRPWPQPGAVPELLPHEVHIWSASLDTGRGLSEYYESCLDRWELRRASKYSLEPSRKRFVCARGILKELLGQYVGYTPAQISFSLGSFGKPYFPAEISKSLNFNSTDTEDEALFAVCMAAEVGIDIELDSRNVRHQAIARRKFSRQEMQQYEQCPASRQKQFFLKIWTRKEAYGKAKGVGIRYRLNSVNLVDDMGSDRFEIQDGDGKPWEVVQISPANGVTACVVIEGTGWHLRFFRVPDVWPGN